MSTAKSVDRDAKFLQKIYSNVKMGSESIINLMPKVKDDELRAYMTTQLNQYEKYASDIKGRLDKKGVPPKEESAMVKLMAKTGMGMKTMVDSTTSHMAEMMVQGSTMDITDLLQQTSAYSRYPECDESISLAKEIVAFEERNVEKMKSFL